MSKFINRLMFLCFICLIMLTLSVTGLAEDEPYCFQYEFGGILFDIPEYYEEVTDASEKSMYADCFQVDEDHTVFFTLTEEGNTVPGALFYFVEERSTFESDQDFQDREDERLSSVVHYIESNGFSVNDSGKGSAAGHPAMYLSYPRTDPVNQIKCNTWSYFINNEEVDRQLTVEFFEPVDLDSRVITKDMDKMMGEAALDTDSVTIKGSAEEKPEQIQKPVKNGNLYGSFTVTAGNIYLQVSECFGAIDSGRQKNDYLVYQPEQNPPVLFFVLANTWDGVFMDFQNDSYQLALSYLSAIAEDYDLEMEALSMDVSSDISSFGIPARLYWIDGISTHDGEEMSGGIAVYYNYGGQQSAALLYLESDGSEYDYSDALIKSSGNVELNNSDLSFDVNDLTPQIRDTLNGYFRAVLEYEAALEDAFLSGEYPDDYTETKQNYIEAKSSFAVMDITVFNPAERLYYDQLSDVFDEADMFWELLKAAKIASSVEKLLDHILG